MCFLDTLALLLILLDYLSFSLFMTIDSVKQLRRHYFCACLIMSWGRSKDNLIEYSRSIEKSNHGCIYSLFQEA